MTEVSQAPTGFLGMLRRLAATALGIVQNRLELLTLELREERARVVSLLIWFAMLVISVFMVMMAVTFLFVVAFWDHAFWVLLAFSFFYLSCALTAILVIKSRLDRPLLGETVNQLKKDCQWLLGKK
jgi:uncharacterized membrane protein YqjE